MLYRFFIIAGIAAGLMLAAAPAEAQTVQDGDLIKTSRHDNVYIAKIANGKKFKRLILNPDIFNQYGHLRWEDIKTVGESTFGEFELSALVRQDGGDKVYKLFGDEDTGEKRWLNLAPQEFESSGFDWDAIYLINANEHDSYNTGVEFNSQNLPVSAFDYGIIPGISSTEDIDKAQELGVDIVRLDPNDLSFTKDDLQSRGIAMMVQELDETPEGSAGIPPPDDYEKWAQDLAEIVGAHPDIKYWQVWNEPNEKKFWYPEPNAGEYVELLKVSYTAIKEANPNAVVVSAGLSGINPPKQYLRDMYAAGAKEYFDVMALHPYGQPNNPDTYLADYLDFMKNIMESYGDLETDIWITEIGWPTDQSQFGAVSEQEQAEYLRRTYEITEGIDYVVKVFWYRMQDAGEGMGILGKPAEGVYKELGT